MIIHKHVLSTNATRLALPVGAKVLDVQYQNGDIVLWEMHPETGGVTVDRLFVIYPTGERFTGDVKHIATVVGPFTGTIWHVFEEFLPC